jgi:KDO2-lipid IV(A) lauroyltransferase
MKERIEYFLFFLLHQIARLASFRLTTRVGSVLGSAVFSLTTLRQKVTFDNLRHAFPEKSEEERRAIAAGAYRTYGIAVTQMLWAGNASPGELKSKVHFSTLDPFEKALCAGKGLILMSAHFGAWELLITSVRLNLGRRLIVIAQTQRNKKINALLDRLRSRFDNQIVPMSRSVRQVVKALQEKEVVAMLGDQSGPKEAVFVDFFGRPAATHRGPAVFSLRNGTPILMFFLVRRPDGTYDAIFEEVDRTGLDRYTEENVLELTRRHTAVLERFVRRFPDHWLWMHKRWKHTEFFETHQQVHKGSAERAGHYA